jgi:UDP-glucuronate 4-epimerase
MAHCYSHLFGLPTTGLRFFTVYGPSNRPDMAISLFTDAILAGRPIKVFNHGEMSRDFTYVGDIVEAVSRVMMLAPEGPGVPWRVFNIGSGRPVKLTAFIDELERQLGRTAIREYLPLQPGDVPSTHADIEDLVALTGYRPATTVAEGIRQFVSWYRNTSP